MCVDKFLAVLRLGGKFATFAKHKSSLFVLLKTPLPPKGAFIRNILLFPDETLHDNQTIELL